MTHVATEEKPKQPPEDPGLGPNGPRTPYPVDEPVDPRQPGSEPDYFPGKPGSDVPAKMRAAAPGDIHVGRRRRPVSWLQAH
jgi:hypothetical protein